jgi:hypothetical protein
LPGRTKVDSKQDQKKVGGKDMSTTRASVTIEDNKEQKNVLGGKEKALQLKTTRKRRM